MSGRIDIEFAAAEGAVLRMLGLVERRGFEVKGIALSHEGVRGSLALEVRARDESRSLDIVAAQLRRLVDVRHVSFTTPAGASQ